MKENQFIATEPQGRIVALTEECYTLNVDPSQLWVHYNPKADSLTVYFTGKPVASVWNDVDQYRYIGFALDDETTVTGVMIEHFSKWLLLSNAPKRSAVKQAIGEKIVA